MTAAVALVVLPAERWLCFTYGVLATILASLIVLAAAAAWDHHTRRDVSPEWGHDRYLGTLADLHALTVPHYETGAARPEISGLLVPRSGGRPAPIAEVGIYDAAGVLVEAVPCSSVSFAAAATKGARWDGAVTRPLPVGGCVLARSARGGGLVHPPRVGGPWLVVLGVPPTAVLTERRRRPNQGDR